MAFAISKRSTPTVLMVEDDDFSQEVLLVMLMTLGVTGIHFARNGRDALRLSADQRRPFDLCICDIFMPEMDGIELVGHLASQGYYGDIILISGGDAEMLGHARLIAQRNGLNVLASLTKPLALAALMQALLSPAAQSPYLTAVYPFNARQISVNSY